MKNINSFNVTVEKFGKNQFIGYVNDLRGLVVQGRSKDEILITYCKNYL